MEGKRFGMLIDMRKCIGCQACTVSCSVENPPPVGQFRTTVLQYEVDKADGSAPAMVSLPRLCNHCDNPPCVPVCPVQATFQRSDGIVLVDNERCVGCGYCVQACPYDARFINRETQTADKCTFCEHRLEAAAAGVRGELRGRRPRHRRPQRQGQRDQPPHRRAP